jgi:transposase
MSAKMQVHLAADVRRELERVARSQTAKAAKVRRARVLLLADEDHAEGQRPDTYIATVVGLSEKQVKTIRQKFVREGLTALERKPRVTPPTPRKLDGRAEAQLVALCCSTPPGGRQRWTLQLLADELGRLEVVTSICPETVRQCLKKTGSSLGEPSGSASPRTIARGSSRRWSRSSTSIAKRTTNAIR